MVDATHPMLVKPCSCAICLEEIVTGEASPNSPCPYYEDCNAAKDAQNLQLMQAEDEAWRRYEIAFALGEV